MGACFGAQAYTEECAFCPCSMDVETSRVLDLPGPRRPWDGHARIPRVRKLQIQRPSTASGLWDTLGLGSPFVATFRLSNSVLKHDNLHVYATFPGGPLGTPRAGVLPAAPCPALCEFKRLWPRGSQVLVNSQGSGTLWAKTFSSHKGARQGSDGTTLRFE